MDEKKLGLSRVNEYDYMQGLGFESMISKFDGKKQIMNAFLDELGNGIGNVESDRPTAPFSSKMYTTEENRRNYFVELSKKYNNLIEDNENKTGDKYSEILTGISDDANNSFDNIDRRDRLLEELYNIDFNNKKQILDFISQMTNWPYDKITSDLLFTVIDHFKKNGFPSIGDEFEIRLDEDKLGDNFWPTVKELSEKQTKFIETECKDDKLKKLIYTVLYSRYISMNFDWIMNNQIQDYKKENNIS